MKPSLYDLGMRLGKRALDPRREALVAPASGRVLELGIGTGLNLPCYSTSSARVVGVDPDPAMLKLAHRRAAASATRVGLVVGSGEALPFGHGVFDQVVACLVLCSVASPAQTLAEVHRVLKPGGQLRFFEHVRSENGAWAGLQDLVAPAWGVLVGGCHPNRTTVEAIERGGFTVDSIERFPLGPYPTRPMVLGIARRPT
ncbi:MAG: class I SAM-dependent methyltransferase [Chloroflexi bacterium]|nr:class I SAM-dependent methyltransferase [Chloroflexota bacterium]